MNLGILDTGKGTSKNSLHCQGVAGVKGQEVRARAMKLHDIITHWKRFSALTVYSIRGDQCVGKATYIFF